MSMQKVLVSDAAKVMEVLRQPDRAGVASGLISNAGAADRVFNRLPRLWTATRKRLHGAAGWYDRPWGLDFQRALRRLIEFQIAPTHETGRSSGYLQALAHLAGREWVESELRLVPDDPLPAGGFPEVNEWFERVIGSHPAPRHPLYDFLEAEATAEDFLYFVRQETTVDAGFADLLALLQLGPLPWKQEVARNYWDEMGEGDGRREHGRMFARVLEKLGAGEFTEEDLLAESLACGNLLFWLCASRPHGLMGIGALAATELAVPYRFSKIVNAVRRLDLPPEVGVYYSTHVEGDEEHAESWIKKVICPALAASPASAVEIARGVYLRLNTSLRYCEAVLSELRRTRAPEPSGAQAAAEPPAARRGGITS